MPAGAGGAEAKVGNDPVLYGKVSEAVGKMAQEFTRQTEPEGDKDPDAVVKAGEKVVRGDGTVLEDRGDTPRNPKKKMFEANVEDQKQEDRQRKRDEL